MARGDQKVSHKQEAFAGLNALLGILKTLTPGKPISGLDIEQMKTCVFHAHGNVEKIQEVQRVRKPKEQDPVKP